ncbi:hypothetical protein LUZ63_014427 [Rhynchospora breviuscula]|uniref:Complex 1 LYR protein domain-containing protein n=1 Tax=Rhynchospora breviuscula TaxID=2022672 RepID=A0A9Q0CAH2_9POAL|nr:hypothetical protein LUZ63_014427 [Rhynchospora breviuscula]
MVMIGWVQIWAGKFDLISSQRVALLCLSSLTISQQRKRKSKRKGRMPSLQASLPPELADNVIRLYRECLRRAKYIGQQKHNTELLVNMVRQQFKRHKDETDPEKIQKLKDDAARGLVNHILYESEQLTGRSVFKTK